MLFNAAADLGNNGGTTNTITAAYTSGSGSNRLLIVSLLGDTSVDDITSVTYAGVAMTLAQKLAPAATDNRVTYLYYLLAPATGSNNVVVTSTASHYLVIGAADYTAVAQSGQPDAVTTHAGSGAITTLTTAITTIADNSWFIGLENGYDDSNDHLPPVAGTGGTRRYFDAAFGTAGIFDSNGPVTPAGSYSVTTTRTTASTTIQHVFSSFAPDTTASIPTLTLRTNTGPGSPALPWNRSGRRLKIGRRDIGTLLPSPIIQPAWPALIATASAQAEAAAAMSRDASLSNGAPEPFSAEFSADFSASTGARYGANATSAGRGVLAGATALLVRANAAARGVAALSHILFALAAVRARGAATLAGATALAGRGIAESAGRGLLAGLTALLVSGVGSARARGVVAGTAALVARAAAAAHGLDILAGITAIVGRGAGMARALPALVTAGVGSVLARAVAASRARGALLGTTGLQARAGGAARAGGVLAGAVALFVRAVASARARGLASLLAVLLARAAAASGARGLVAGITALLAQGASAARARGTLTVSLLLAVRSFAAAWAAGAVSRSAALIARGAAAAQASSRLGGTVLLVARGASGAAASVQLVAGLPLRALAAAYAYARAAVSQTRTVGVIQFTNQQLQFAGPVAETLAFAGPLAETLTFPQPINEVIAQT